MRSRPHARSSLLIRALSFALGVGGCASSQSPTPLPDEHRGLYEYGYEANHFRPCADGRGATWQVRIDSALAVRVRTAPSAPGAFNSEAAYVRWRGRFVTPAPPSPPRIQPPGPGWFEVAEVLEARAPRPGECGYERPR